jgi:hypothetical protein
MGAEHGQIDPRVLNVMNLSEWQRIAAPLMGVPPEALNTVSQQEEIEAAQQDARAKEDMKGDVESAAGVTNQVAPLAKLIGEGGAVGGTQDAVAAGIGLG